MQGDVDLAQCRETFIDKLHIQLLRWVARAVRESPEVVHLQAVDDVHFGAVRHKIQGKVMPNETRAADQRHAAPIQFPRHPNISR